MPSFKSQSTLTFGCEGSRLMLAHDRAVKQGFFKDAVSAGRASFEQMPKSGAAQKGNEKWTPKEEDMIRVPFRLISAAIVAAYTWRATDFTNVTVLKKSVPLLAGVPAYTDHMQYGDRFIGVVETTAWDEQRMDGADMIPPGINGMYMIDAKNNEKLAAGLLMQPPAIKSSSVTVLFNWEPSHEYFEDERDFLNNIGKIGADGRLVSRKVTGIIQYNESSILWMGADPFAKMLDSTGKPMGVDKDAIFAQATEYAKEFNDVQKKIFATASLSKSGLFLSHKDIESQEKHTKTQKMEKFLEALAKEVRQLLGLADDVELTQAHIDSVKLMKVEDATAATAAVENLGKIQGEFTQYKTSNPETLKTEIENLKKDKTTLEGKLTTAESLAAEGKKVVENKRKAATEAYKKQMGDKATDAVVNVIMAAEGEALEGFLAQYTKGLTEKFTATCKECGKSDCFEFRSSVASPEDGKNGKTVVDPDKDFQTRF